MRLNHLKNFLAKVAFAAAAVLLAEGAASAQTVVNLTANPTTTTLPDGTVVPMWGYFCNDAGTNGSCAALNGTAPAGAWSPPVITVPTGNTLTINLTNNLSFSTGTAANTVPTSLTIVGQLGGGLGTPSNKPSPAHPPLPVTWSTANTGAEFTPPSQPPRVQSFATEVPYGTTATPLIFSSLRPGTYLMESGTHPSIQGPMGLYGILVVTTAPASGIAGTAYAAATSSAAVTYNAELPLLFSEIDPVQNNAVNTAVSTAGFSETATRSVKIQPSPLASVGIASGGSGYSSNPTVNIVGGGGSGATATVTVTAGVITAITLTNAGNGYTSDPTVTITDGTGAGASAYASVVSPLVPNSLAQCSPPADQPSAAAAAACYPPAVNYTPAYYMINGVAFDKTNAARSVFPVTPASTGAAPVAGNVLVRLVNAGLRMHVPSMVGTQTGTAAAGGFSLIAEDGNPLPGVPRVQSEVFMAAGKTYDVMINAPAAYGPAIPVYDRELSLSGNAVNRDAGMLAYIGINGNGGGASAATATSGNGLPALASTATAAAVMNDAYAVLVAGKTFSVTDPSKGVIANDTNVYGVTLLAQATSGTVTLNRNGTFTYVPNGTGTADSFTYCANGTVTAGVCSSGLSATVNLSASTIVDNISCSGASFTSTMATYIAVKTPGVLAGCTSSAKLPLTIATASIGAPTALPAGATAIPACSSTAGPTPPCVLVDQNGGVTAIVGAAGTYAFGYQAQDSQGHSSSTATATLVFPAGSGLNVTVLDGATKDTANPITDYRWIIEEDRTFYVDPTKLSNVGGTSIVPTLGVNFHTSYMPFVAQGCTGALSCEGGQTVLDNDPSSATYGQHIAAVCDVGNGACRLDTTGNGFAQVLPSQVYLDPTKRYYISILPGDAANPFIAGTSYATSPGATTATGPTGHGMGGAPIGIDPNTHLQATAVTVLTQPTPFPPAALSVFVYEDDFPLNGENDSGGGVDVLSPVEPGLGGFQIHLWDAMGGNGDFTGQMTYDMFNQPLSNSLDGTVDPLTGLNACPITQTGLNSANGTATGNGGITSMIVTCPKYEGDGKTLSPLAGQAVIRNLMPGRFGVVATPGADRIARGEEWLQTNTLDGQKAHDSFVRIGEPTYFQEYGPAGFHVSVGFANPAIINARLPFVCNGSDANSPSPGTVFNCNNTLTGRVTGEHLSRTPDERLYSSGSHDAFYWTQCYVSVGDPDGEDFAFAKCNSDGTFKLTGLPQGNWRITTFDQWNDQLVDGLSTPVQLGSASNLCPGAGSTQFNCNMGDIAATQWQTNLYTKTFIDDNKDGIYQPGETGIPFANVAVRLRDGSLENLLLTDFTGTANFNETFPLFSWYTVETDVTRYKNTGTHAVYDVGGPVDGSPSCGVVGYPPCGPTNAIAKNLANTAELVSLPTNLRVPGAVYCKDADCSTHATGILGGSSTSDPPSACTTSTTAPFATTCSTLLSSGRIDPPWVGVEGWQGFPGQNNFLEFGKAPYVSGENGGIKGHVIYASTRPFDDPQLLVQTQWEPLVPNVTINLYREGFASDGVTPTLTLVDTTKTSSWDDFAQGFRADGVTPNMNCPGQGGASGAIPDLFYFSLYNQPDYLNAYNAAHGGPAATQLPYNSQFKCYDGMHNWNQLQPAPYDGMYKFPSVTAVDANGKPTTTGTNCTICTPNPATDLYSGIPQLPPGKYVVEVVVPPGFELVKEEDKNILIGDNFIAPVTQQFGGLGNVFIMPDQASVAGTVGTGNGYNPNNPQNPTNSLGASPQNGIVPGFVPEPVWPCVGEARVVPDYISLYPQSKQVAPFAGATRRLCDRKEVTLNDQMGAIAKFYIYTSAHMASKFTGGITDDYTSEFDPFSPQFGEKFAPPALPVAVRDWTGNETNRVYADNWGSYNGMTYSTWEVNPPNPTGYSPTMMVFCMNDAGPIKDTRVGSATNGQMIPDPLYTPGYSQFCYELPFMPGTTQYLDTPVVPTSAFAGAGYNNVDCSYPNATPAIASVAGNDGVAGPWVKQGGSGHTLTITALGDQTVPNYAYSGPSATSAPFNTKTITRHYGFGTTQGTGTVTIGGASATVVSWSDTQIVVTVPATGTATGQIPPCAVQQQSQYANNDSSHPSFGTAYCGQLVITAGNGRSSVDTVTVTVGGKMPYVLASAIPMSQYAPGSIQKAIDAAAPGDMIVVPSGAYTEMLIMWKPVRLQGVGAGTTILNANTQPAGKLDTWRAYVNCLFGLALNGQPGGWSTSCNAWGFNYFTATGAGSGAGPNPQVDRLPLEAVVGWDASQNGNLAELLQEPSLMGALEGAGVTVLGKGVNFHGAADPFGAAGGAAGAFPAGTTLLTTNDCGATPNPFPSNFQCNPSAIDGLTLTNSSQGGGAIFVHAWAHNLQIANNRINGNAGTLSGGINVGQGEFPPAYINGGTTNAAPGSCATTSTGGVTSFAGHAIPVGAVEPYCHNLNVNIHNNSVSLNSSTGDELFSATPAGAGGVSITTGADSYSFTNNWVCGNLSSGDGGGFGQLGLSYYGMIQHNSFLFNQSLNPTIPANGGGLVIMGAPDADPTCGATTDLDCVPSPGSIGPSDGIGAGLVIDANLIMGNAAEAGTGGGIAFQNVNGSDVVAFPTQPQFWWNPTVTNNIIANNVAGWDGAGISLLDALNINIVNNTIMSNVSTATAGVLFNTIGAPLASQQGTACTSNCGTTSNPQPSGLVTIQNSAVLSANMPTTVTCPQYHYAGSTASNGSCVHLSYPLMDNNVFWQNSSFQIGVGALSNAFQQNVVTLYNAFTSPATTPVSQTVTGQCVTGTSYWDIGVRGDTGPGNHNSGYTLTPNYSVLTNPSENGLGTNNLLGINPKVASQYCNGARTPPEACASTGGGNNNGGCGWNVPPGIADATVPNPIFNLTPVATVDEGNNWINLRWGPLSLVNPVTGTVLGNYAQLAGSPVIDYIPSSAGEPYTVAPPRDFFGTSRKTDNHVDVGAVEFASPVTTPILIVTPSPASFGNVVDTTTATLALTLRNDGTAATGIAIGTPTGAASITRTGGTCGANLGGGATCTVTLRFAPPAAAGAVTYTATLTITATGTTVNGSPVTITGTGIPAVRTASVTPTTLNFGNWATGTTSSTQSVTITNTGNVALAGGAFTTAAPFARSNAGAFPGTAPNCGAALAVGASCTIKVQFTPTAVTTYAGSLAVAYTGATVTGTPVTLNGTGVATRATVSIAPNPLTITLPTGSITGVGTVTLTNTAPTGGAQILVTGVATASPGESILTWFFLTGALVGGDTCTGTTLAPGGSCTVNVDFTNLLAPRGVNRAGTITFTDNGAGGTQTGNLIGHAN